MRSKIIGATLLVLALLSLSASALESGETVEGIDSRIYLLNTERQELLRRLAELDRELAELASRREKAAFAEEAKGGVFVQTASKAIMRSAPSPTAEAIMEIPGKVRLRALDFVSAFWKVEYAGLLGYISDAYMVLDRQAQAHFAELKTQARGAESMIPAPVISPTDEEGGSGSPGAKHNVDASGASSRPSDGGLKRQVSVRCSAYTQKGTRCQRRTTNPSGRCWQHER